MTHGRTASSVRVTLLALALSARAVAAQEPDSARAARDSLTARLERAEEAIELLRQQLAAQSEAEVRTLSRVSVDLTRATSATVERKFRSDHVNLAIGFQF